MRVYSGVCVCVIHCLPCRADEPHCSKFLASCNVQIAADWVAAATAAVTSIATGAATAVATATTATAATTITTATIVAAVAAPATVVKQRVEWLVCKWAAIIFANQLSPTATTPPLPPTHSSFLLPSLSLLIPFDSAASLSAREQIEIDEQPPGRRQAQTCRLLLAATLSLSLSPPPQLPLPFLLLPIADSNNKTWEKCCQQFGANRRPNEMGTRNESFDQRCHPQSPTWKSEENSNDILTLYFPTGKVSRKAGRQRLKLIS